MRKKLRKNPILHIINEIRYEIIDPPIYDETKIIKIASEIIENKFPNIINKIPIIEFKNFNKLHFAGEYNAAKNKISINSKYPLKYNRYRIVKTFFHELGHFIYRKYLDSNSLKKFNNYVNENMKYINIKKLKNLMNKYSTEELQTKFPLIYNLISNLKFTIYYDMYREKNKIQEFEIQLPNINFLDYIIKEFRKIDEEPYINLFKKADSSYMPNKEEIFCEIFAHYMVYDKKLLQTDNYRMLKTILPELR